jgi:hypothetical protein
VTEDGIHWAARNASTRSGAATTIRRSTHGAAASASMVQASNGRPPIGARSLSTPAILREDPAATITTSARGPPAIPPATR